MLNVDIIILTIKTIIISRGMQRPMDTTAKGEIVEKVIHFITYLGHVITGYNRNKIEIKYCQTTEMSKYTYSTT